MTLPPTVYLFESGTVSLPLDAFGGIFRDEKAVTLSSGAKLNLTDYASDTGDFSGADIARVMSGTAAGVVEAYRPI